MVLYAMLLADVDIKKALKENRIIVKPKPVLREALSACALDLRLDHEFQLFEHTQLAYFNPKKKISQTMVKKIHPKKGEPFVLQPGEFALASTLEWIELPDNIAGRLEGRSSLGRLGIVIHSTASLIHPGFKGHIVLELGNHSRVAVGLYPKMRVCSLSFEELTRPAEKPYYKQKGAKYTNQKGVTASRIDKEMK